MAIVMTLTAEDMKQKFEKIDRDYFSLEACEKLIEISDDENVPMEFDPIAICCEWREATPEEIVDDYDNIREFAECRTEDGIDIEMLFDALCNHTISFALDNEKILFLEF